MVCWVFLIAFQQSGFPCLLKQHKWQTVSEVISPKYLRYKVMEVQSKLDAVLKEWGKTNVVWEMYDPVIIIFPVLGLSEFYT